jgi:HAMP domain-containing protein
MTRVGLTLAAVAAFLAVAAACSEATTGPTVNGPDMLVNDTMDIDSGDLGASPPPASDTGADAALYPDATPGYAPMLEECAACECSTKKGFCFAGGAHFSGAGGSGDGGGDGGGGPAACAMVPADTVSPGCNTLPAACAGTPTCDCVLSAIQTMFECYLVCTPDDGYLLVYCPNGP